MIVGTTNTGKKFILDRVRPVVFYQGFNYYLTASGNIVRDNEDGTYLEISRGIAEDHILLMPYDIAKELFPSNPVFVETI